MLQDTPPRRQTDLKSFEWLDSDIWISANWAEATSVGEQEIKREGKPFHWNWFLLLNGIIPSAQQYRANVYWLRNFCYAVPDNNFYTLLLENISLSFFLPSFLSFFPSAYALFHTLTSERDCTPLRCFYKVCIQSNQQLALSRLMHSIHCGNAIFSYQALERPAEETL
jgi:hypothetical protein